MAPKMPSGSGNFGAASAMPSGGTMSRPTGTTVRDLEGGFAAGGFGFAWRGLPGLMALPDTAVDDMMAIADDGVHKMAADIEAYMKEYAPWKDQTGDARAGLKALPVSDTAGGRFIIHLGYSVDYGTFLETHNGGEYAIIGPTIEEFSRRFGEYLLEAAK